MFFFFDLIFDKFIFYVKSFFELIFSVDDKKPANFSCDSNE